MEYEYDSSARKIDIARHHIFFHHNPKTNDGFITMAKKDIKTGSFRQYHYKPEELADHLTEYMGEDVFFSQNTFYKPQRSIQNIRQLKSLYVDLDFYLFNYDTKWVLGKLEYEFYQKTIPEPNLIIFSGQGVVLIWLIEPVPYKALPLWQAVQNHFLQQLKGLGGDSKAADAARVFRVAGTTSSKNGNEVHVEYRHEHHYGLRELQFEYLPELTPITKPTEKKKPNNRKKVVKMFNTFTLHHARLLDIVKIVELRNYDLKGKREIVCFLYRYWLCCFLNDPKTALQDTLELNRMFVHPLTDTEVTRATKSAEKAWEARSNADANKIAVEKGYPGAGYNISNKKLIDWLDIDRDEMRELQTIIDTNEKRNRNTANKMKKRRAQGIKPREEYLKQKDDKMDVIKSVLADNPNLSIRKIVEQTGIPRSTIARLKKLI